MTKEELAARYGSEMTDVCVSPQLKNTTLRRLEHRKEPVMKQKWSAILVFVVLMIFVAAAALAAVVRLGILDFAGNHQGAYVPEDAQQYVQSDVLHMENELVTVDLHELYYDGLIARMTLDVKPKNDKTMLLGEDISLDDPWIYMTPMAIEVDKTYTQTVLDVYKEGGYESVYSTIASLNISEEDGQGGSRNYSLNEDGTLTLYIQRVFADAKPQRNGTVRLTLFPYDENLERINLDGRIDLEQTITVTEAAYDAQTYQSTQPVEFTSAGVRIDKLTLEVRAQEIHAAIDYTVVDEDAYAALENGLWFEFIDPNRTETEPVHQNLHTGLMGGGQTGPVSDDGRHYRQIQTLGRNELHSTYTLRVCLSWSNQLFETHNMTVELVTDK